MLHRCADCPALTNRTRCPTCTTQANTRRGTSTQRGYGTQWQKTSALAIQRDNGLCQLRLPVCTVIATTADHIIPKAHGGTDDLDNLQGACRPCNSSKRDRPTTPPQESPPCHETPTKKSLPSATSHPQP